MSSIAQQVVALELKYTELAHVARAMYTVFASDVFMENIKFDPPETTDAWQNVLALWRKELKRLDVIK